uniref:Bacteriophage Rz lysis protein n=1 Tax=Candidatus Kentrum sp. UNK TaxID=2126344 RepID=A0A451ANX1_9GAMM|nr:MAG: hypothetical protein BECKUNK1418G_GA0071005_115914 [Candidatus Kentron sp. UNK]VFK73054.1 MAG: hypothetical protein BECKUNK1418H_GA0071006_115914 [Candidatus Kentron sp. UNK]
MIPFKRIARFLMPSLFKGILSGVGAKLLLPLLLAGATSLGSWFMTSKVKNAEIAHLEASYAEARTATAQAAQERLAVAVSRGEDLTRGLIETTNLLRRTHEKHQQEIARVTSGRACLGPGALRLLNETGAGVDGFAALPDAASGFAATDGAIATDTDVAGWIADAKRRYAACRARLDALIDWSEAL